MLPTNHVHMNLNLLSQTLAHLKLFPFRSECLILLAAVSLFTVFTDKGLLIKENEVQALILKYTRQKGFQVLGRK